MTFDARAAGPKNGELVLLLHGFPETSYAWRHVMVSLAREGFRTVAPDQRGYSPDARPKAVADYAVSLLVQDALDMATALGADRFHLVGHDWGATVAWRVAATAPDRVRSLTALSVGHPDALNELRGDPTSDQYRASAYFDNFVQPNSEDGLLLFGGAPLRNLYTSAGLEPSAVDQYMSALGSKEALGAGLNWYRANVKNRVSTAPPIGPIVVPTLYIWSDQDPAISEDGALLTAKYVTGPYQYETLEGVNHWLPDLAAERVNAVLVPHVQAH